MGRLIDTDDLKKRIKCGMLYAGELMCIIDDCKTVDAETSYHGEWISVSEKMPEEHEDYEEIFDPMTLAVVDTKLYKCSDLVLVTVYDGNQDKIFVTDDCTVDGKWANYREDYSFEVLAWMPMPAPYKVEE